MLSEQSFNQAVEVVEDVVGSVVEVHGADVDPVDEQGVWHHGVTEAEGGRSEDVVQGGVTLVVIAPVVVQAVRVHGRVPDDHWKVF